MKKIISLILITALSLLICGCSKITPDGYKKFRSTPVGIIIEYPADWDSAYDNSNRSIAFAAPSIGLADEFRENVTIVAEELEEEDGSFDEYVKTYIQSLKTSVSQYQYISEKSMTVASKPAHQIIYEGSSDKIALRFKQIFVQGKNRVFIISYIAQLADYTYFEVYADRMVQSFELIGG